jgi:hypothetical protein
MKLQNIRITAFLAVSFSLLFFGGVIEAKAPAEVQNVEVSLVSGSDTSVKIVWDEANAFDDIVIGYKVYYGNQSVKDIGVTYDQEVTLENETEYKLDNLSPGETYYFAVTALNTAGEESETYSKEVTFTLPTPKSSLKVISAIQTGITQIRVQMSGLVQISNLVDAFLLEQVSPSQEIGIVSGEVQGDSILLNTQSALEKDGRYRITATSAVKDTEGTPVSSGITDTVEFLADFVAPEPEIIPEPEVIISEPVVEVPEPEIIPDPVPVVEEIRVPFGPELPPNFQREEEPEMKPAAPDLEAPLDVTQLMYDTSRLESDHMVVLTWKRSLDQEGDVRDQVIYVRENKGFWDNGYSVGKDIEFLEIEVEKGKNYEIRVSTIDQSGNESAGTFTSFATQLSQSGPSMAMVLAIGAGILFFLFIIGRRRA